MADGIVWHIICNIRNKSNKQVLAYVRKEKYREQRR